jgi:Asp/Glu/hydantoin racemase
VTGPILVINPNSNQAVTDGIDAALAGFRHSDGPAIECLTLMEGPFGIESQLDADSVILPLARLVESRRDASAIVIACYSDPGIDACRSVATQPVFGIQESGVLTALARGERFGVLAIAEASIARQRRYLQRLGLIHRLAGVRPTHLSVDESARGANAFQVLARVGQQLRGDGADALILGCAGMARHRAQLEQALNIPVIDPTLAAVAMASGVVCAA